MSKTIELIYSQQATDYIPGRAYSNPRFFTSPRSGVSKVFLVGDWPEIRAAYENLGVPVERLDAKEAERHASPIAPAPAPKTAEDPGAVEIPANWLDLPWSKPGPDGLTLRGLASSLSAVPILNKEKAYDAIKGELHRRTLDAPVPGAGDLTLRQLQAELVALGIRWDNDASPADLLAQRDEARMLAEAG